MLCGDNGSGKSSLQEAIDFTLFGVVRGKERKRVPQTELPNRINGALLTSVKFTNNNNDDILIERGLRPQKLKVTSSDNDITTRYKKLPQEEKDNIIGINYELYKSFISMSLNDFNNFINLDPETKRKLLNRLFNLSELDKYYEISKDIIKSNNRNIEKIQIDITNNNNTIEQYKNNIKAIRTSSSDESQKTKDEIKSEILSKRSMFTEIKEIISDIGISINSANIDLRNRQNILSAKKHKISKLSMLLDDYNKKIDVFNKGVCPLCGTVLKNSKHDHDLDVLINKKQDIEDDILTTKKEMDKYKLETITKYNERKKLITEKNKLTKQFNELVYDLRSLKNEYDKFDKDNVAISELNKNILTLKDKNKKHKEIIDNIKERNSKYEILNQIFSTSGIRKSIIENTVKPINEHLTYYLGKLNSSFRVEINNEFDADIYERYINKIHPETLSSGEARKINMALALSYIEIIRKIRKSNILFLDEIFANVDYDNIDILLKSLKDFTRKYKMTIIIVNHSQVNTEIFDRIIEIEKRTFSFIRDYRK